MLTSLSKAEVCMAAWMHSCSYLRFCLTCRSATFPPLFFLVLDGTLTNSLALPNVLLFVVT